MHLNPTLRKATELSFALTAIATLFLAGCGGGGSSSTNGGTTPAATTTTTVTPFKGMFTSGNVTLVDANGNPVTLSAGGSINASGVASVTFPASVAYPLTVNVTGIYLDETNGNAPATISGGSPLQGLIPTAASSVPVTAVTHMARTMLPSTGFSAASAVAAITGAASSVLGVYSYSQAMLPPVFDAQGKTSDINTLKLAALANVIGQHTTGADLSAKLNDIANKMKAGSAVSALIPPSTWNAAVTAVNVASPSGMVPSGVTPPTIPPFVPPNSSLGNGSSGSTGAGSGGVTPSISSFSPISGTGGITVTITGANLDSFTPAPLVKFGTLVATSSLINNQTVTATVPTTLPGGNAAITISNGDGTGGISVGFYNNVKTVAVLGTQQGGSRQGVALSIAAGSGVVSTFAGTSSFGSSDGISVAATLYGPSGITTDGTNLYFSERGNNTIRKAVISTGQVVTIAGSRWVTAASVDGLGTAASFNQPTAITTDGVNLYVVDSFTNKIRKIAIATGAVTTLAGSGTIGATDGIGSAASFNNIVGLTTDGTNVYVADTGNNTIRQVVISTGQVTTLAGSGISGSLDGPGISATFNQPMSITTDGTVLYVGDSNNLRQIVIASGAVSTLGTGLSGLTNLSTDGANLYSASTGTIKKIDLATLSVSILAGGLPCGSGYACGFGLDGTGSAAKFNTTNGITTDGAALYVTDQNGYYGNFIRKVW